MNFEEAVKVMKKVCKCGTKMCSNWECTCDVNSDTGELEEECTCPACGCEDCSTCQVTNKNTLTRISQSQAESASVS